jgi:hypothetical protein
MLEPIPFAGMVEIDNDKSLVDQAPYHPGYEDVGFESKMNANELAYKWEHTAFISEESKQECGNKMATMLRQQQAQIEVLRNQLWDLKSEPWGFDRKAQEK